MTPDDFVTKIIEPAHTTLVLDSIEAQAISLGTAINETEIRNIMQIGGGPGTGYWQDEQIDHDDLWTNWLSARPVMAMKVRSLLPAGVAPSIRCLIPYPIYAAAICRLHYERAPGALPTTLAGQAAYYKAHYNTAGGAASVQEYIDNWTRMTAGSAFLDRLLTQLPDFLS